MAGWIQELVDRGFELRETHISWVFLGPEDVYKLKKPVNFGFVDFTSMDQREQACRAEVDLNQRLAPDVYLGHLALVRDAQGNHQFVAPHTAASPILDWAVHMRRLPDRDRADFRLAQQRLSPQDLAELAEVIVDFHDRARCDAETSRYGTREVIESNVRENFAQTQDSIHRYLTEQECDQLLTWQLDFLEQHTELFEERMRAGRVRDGHGDLRLEHAYMDEERHWTIIDCIEFNERFRYADVYADIAFLFMDLMRHDRSDLAERLLATYARQSGDYEGYRLLDFYESYRAFVRAKVTSFRVDDTSLPSVAREQAALETRRYYLLAVAASRKPTVPSQLIMVGGLIASGKTTVAEAIARELTAPLISSDQTRKQTLGIAPTEPRHEAAWQGTYAPERGAAVYTEMLRRADAVLWSGRSVVLDASFRSRAQRQAAQHLALRHGVEAAFIECRTPRDISLARLAQRERAPHVSDGRREIYDAFAARWEPMASDEVPRHQVLDTTRPLHSNLDDLRTQLPMSPTGSVGR